MECTHGTLLDGMLRYDQPRHGYRTGIEPVLLAAGVPARPGDLVMEAGTGAGAGLLCLSARVPGVRALGIERDQALAGLAQANAAANGFDLMTVMAADLLMVPIGPQLDHAMANPPWHLESASRAIDPMRDAAKRGRPGLIADWIRALSVRLRHRGTLTLIMPARETTAALTALTAAGCGTAALLPLWPAPGREARIVLLQGVQGGRGGTRVLPGLVLHDPADAFSTAAQAILRAGAALSFGRI